MVEGVIESGRGSKFGEMVRRSSKVVGGSTKVVGESELSKKVREQISLKITKLYKKCQKYAQNCKNVFFSKNGMM
jgi:hypothetical protein